MTRGRRPRSVGCAIGMLLVGSAAAFAEAGDTQSLPGYLAAFELDRAARSFLEEPLPWDDAKSALALRVLARLHLAPAERMVAWEREAMAIGDEVTALGDRLVRVDGRAVRVAPAAADAATGGATTARLVRLLAADGRAVDVLAAAVPAAWLQGRTIDEPAEVVGLPLAVGTGPTPAFAGEPWPSPPPDLLLAGGRVAWHPATALGRLGMDYGLFDTVVDGRPLTAADGDALYALLAAVGRGDTPTEGAPPITDLIDPAARWFTHHRGEPVRISGVCRRATRIEIDDPLRRAQAGTDHYWEVFVFVETPLLQIYGRMHETYPVVGCVRELPAGMPTGPTINERVDVAGFGFKRYAYPLPPTATDGGAPRRLEVPLIVGTRAIWRPAALRSPAAPPTAAIPAVVVPLAAALGALAWWGWSHGRRPPRRTLPTTLRLPDDGPGS
ncbi:MAG: hypothetical protein ACKOCW_05900 [Planctomycetaceae bacterium]